MLDSGAFEAGRMLFRVVVTVQAQQAGGVSHFTVEETKEKISSELSKVTTSLQLKSRGLNNDNRRISGYLQKCFEPYGSNHGVHKAQPHCSKSPVKSLLSFGVERRLQ